MTRQPLQGIRVLAVEQYGAGPYATMHMADLGAEVIKIETPARPGMPAGDSARHSGPHFLGESDSQFFQTFNRNKRSVLLDLRDERGRKVFRKLAATSDAVINNLRGDQPAKLGLTYAALKETNARLVCGHLSGYGRSGERAAWPAYDYLMQAEAGYLHLTGEPGTSPARMGLSMVDFMTGVTTAFAVTAALVGALKTGKGCDVDVTLYDVAMHQLTYPATWYLNERDVTIRRPRSGHPSIVPCEMFPTADGWLFVMCVTPRFWALLCEALHRPELTQDPRFRGFSDRLANREALVAILDAAFGEATNAEWMRRLAGKVPAAPVLALDEALDNPYFRGNGGVVTVAHPERGELSLVASPIRVDGARPPTVVASPLGKDTESVLMQAGLTASEIRDLRAGGVI